jgi:hypothetical protein
MSYGELALSFANKTAVTSQRGLAEQGAFDATMQKQAQLAMADSAAATAVTQLHDAEQAALQASAGLQDLQRNIKDFSAELHDKESAQPPESGRVQKLKGYALIELQHLSTNLKVQLHRARQCLLSKLLCFAMSYDIAGGWRNMKRG